MKRRYRRYFIILENEDLGFEVSSQAPKGHAKIEISNDKGSLFLHCQNLKDLQEKRMRYRWYLVNTKKEEPIIVDIGPMVVDENGKGEIVWEFNGENVQASKESIDDFNLLALLVESPDDKKSLVAPLVGYIDKEKVSWRELVESKLYGKTLKPSASNNMTLKPKSEEVKEKEIKPTKEMKPQPEVKPEVKTKNTIETVNSVKLPKEAKPLKEAKSQKDINTEKVIQPNGEQVKEPVIEENQYDKNTKIETNINVQKEEKSKTDKLETNRNQQQENYGHNPYGEDEMNMLRTLQTYIESTVKMFPKTSPFEEEMQGYHWWHIYYNYQTIYRAHMPFIAYIDGIRYPTNFNSYQYPSDYQRQIYQYQHYIFGIAYDENKEVKYYVYGIPGRNLKAEQPYKGSTGFEYWHSSRKGAIDQNTLGYWLLHIDPKTGKVIKPLKATETFDEYN